LPDLHAAPDAGAWALERIAGSLAQWVKLGTGRPPRAIGGL